MINAHQHLFENFPDVADVLEGDRGIDELTLAHLMIDNIVDQVGDILRRGVLQTAGCRFHGIGHHEHDRLPGKGQRTRVMKQLLIGYFLREVLQKTVIEILQYACSMMGPDKIDDRLRKFPLFGDLDSANDVVFDDTGAFFKRLS